MSHGVLDTSNQTETLPKRAILLGHLGLHKVEAMAQNISSEYFFSF